MSAFGSARNSDDGVGIENGRALHPGAHRVARTKLLGLPGAQRLQRVGGQHKGNPVEFFGQKARHGCVPGVGMHDVDLREVLHLRQVQGQGIDGGLELGVAARR